MTKNSTLVFLLTAITFILASACKQKKQYYQESGSVFHTEYHIQYESDRLLTKEIDEELARFNLSLNPFNPNSIISKVNNNEDVETDEWFREVFNKAMEVSSITDGYFDITCAPFVNLWGFGFKNMDKVTPAMIDSLKDFVGYQKVHLNGKKVEKDDPRVLLNCSAIAKGYSCDIIARLLENHGVTNYMVEIGGEVMMSGVNSKGRGWRIGISKPEDDTTGIHRDYGNILQINKKGAIATSGNYRNFYVKDGKKYAHTINPLTGYPSEQNLLSATIIAEDCITADAYATAFMAMGKDRALEIAKKLPGIEYYIIYDQDGKHVIEFSEGLKQYIINK